MRAIRIIKILLKWLAVAVVLTFAVAYFIHHSPWFWPTPEEVAEDNFLVLLIAAERYAVDHEGDFPLYLLGGDKEGWDYYNAHRPEGAPYLCDPLIEEGVLLSYPENPYARIEKWGYKNDKAAFALFTRMIKGPDGRGFDPRFGLNGDKMGNVLIEPFYFVKAGYEIPEGYPRMCPGQFYYKAWGEQGVPRPFYEMTAYDPELPWAGVLPEDRPLVSVQESLPEPNNPVGCNYYKMILGMFGSVDDPGKDTILWMDIAGNIPDEYPFVSLTETYTDIQGMGIDIFLGVPEMYGGVATGGTRYWITYRGEEIWTTIPDGIPDGVVIAINDMIC